MISLDTLTKKPVAVNSYGENVIDLSAASFVYKNDVTVTGSALVTDELEMRPDLIARVYYGDISKLDYLLKFNGISNPFALASGDILLIGSATDMDANFVTASSNPETKSADLRAKFFDANRLSKKDAKRLALVQNKSKAFQNAASNLPPNMADIGSQELKVQNGVVIFGGDVVANANNCPEVLSRAKVKSKLLEQKIFKNV
jgi:hypothetical protein